jgi:hypothetical protein
MSTEVLVSLGSDGLAVVPTAGDSTIVEVGEGVRRVELELVPQYSPLQYLSVGESGVRAARVSPPTTTRSSWMR